MNDDTRKPTIDPIVADTVMTSLFPADTDSWTSRLLGMQKRAVERMRSGYSSTPPRIVEKLRSQIDVRDTMISEIEKAIAKAETAGGHPIVLRYALVDLLKSGRFDGDSDPL